MKSPVGTYELNPFVFAPRYRFARHLLFWIVHVLVFSYIFRTGFNGKPGELILASSMWVPVFILYCYPVMYWLVPEYLLTGKHTRFMIAMVLWAVMGWFLNYLGRRYILFPISEWRGWNNTNRNPWAAPSYLTMNTMMGVGCTVVLFKFWMQKQRAWMQAEQEKVKAELQLLKAQVHPHFLFNTLNNIYAFALEKSPKTPDLVLKLSSLLSYMIYDCREPEVVLEKEIQVMNDYIDLERVRYGNRIDISVETGGDIQGKMIAPLLMLPFLENAFKHGTSQQLEKPWLRFELLVKGQDLRCKIVNSKNPNSSSRDNGIGIANVYKRLELLYPDRHDLKINNEEDFFVASLWIKLNPSLELPTTRTTDSPLSQKNATM